MSFRPCKDPSTTAGMSAGRSAPSPPEREMTIIAVSENALALAMRSSEYAETFGSGSVQSCDHIPTTGARADTLCRRMSAYLFVSEAGIRKACDIVRCRIRIVQELLNLRPPRIGFVDAQPKTFSLEPDASGSRSSSLFRRTMPPRRSRPASSCASSMSLPGSGRIR